MRRKTCTTKTKLFSMTSVEGGFVRTCCTGEGEFGIKRGNNGVLAGLDCSWLASATGWQTTVSSVVWLHCFCASIGGRDNAVSR